MGDRQQLAGLMQQSNVSQMPGGYGISPAFAQQLRQVATPYQSALQSGPQFGGVSNYVNQLAASETAARLARQAKQTSNMSRLNSNPQYRWGY